MKIGLDIHGVIDSNFKMFCELTNMLVREGHEVHVITGPSESLVENMLKDNDIVYTHFFSIVDNAKKNNIGIRLDEDGNPWIDGDFWDRSKAKYCEEQGIDLHLDDSDIYGKHFKTPYARFKK